MFVAAQTFQKSRVKAFSLIFFTCPKGFLLRAGSIFLKRTPVVLRQGQHWQHPEAPFETKETSNYSPSRLFLINTSYLLRPRLIKSEDFLDEGQALWLLRLACKEFTVVEVNIPHYSSLIDSSKWYRMHSAFSELLKNIHTLHCSFTSYVIIQLPLT